MCSAEPPFSSSALAPDTASNQSATSFDVVRGASLLFSALAVVLAIDADGADADVDAAAAVDDEADGVVVDGVGLFVVVVLASAEAAATVAGDVVGS